MKVPAPVAPSKQPSVIVTDSIIRQEIGGVQVSHVPPSSKYKIVGKLNDQIYQVIGIEDKLSYKMQTKTISANCPERER